MSKLFFVSFEDYIKTKNIEKVDNFKEGYKEKINYLSQNEIYKHLENLNDFHKRVMGFNGYMRKRLENNIGRLVEEYKVSLKRLKRDIMKINKNGPNNVFEEYLILCGDKYADRAKQCIDYVYDCGYLQIISRSMKRNEICLGNSKLENIRRSNKLEIVNIEECCYNMVEIDCFTFLNKVKKKNIKMDWSKLVSEFCKLEGLKSNSKEFILALMSYPDEFLRCCDRYRKNKRNWSPERYKARLEKAILLDDNSII